MSAKIEWFDVDRKGFAKLLGARSKSYIFGELFANGWDENSSHVDGELRPIPGKSLCELVVSDDSPDGWADLTHAYTLFAESKKKSDPTKRGWRNFGEKLVLANCERAVISTTTGTVYFGKEGRTRSKERTKQGSTFRAEIRMTRAEYAAICEDVKRFIAPVPTTFNGVYLPQHKELASFEMTLPTVLADEEGHLKRTRRKTTVTVYEPIEKGVSGWLYEMGVPVAPMGDDKFDVDIGQKVPLGLDKTGVSPSYLRQVRVEVLNHTHHLLTEDDAKSNWVDEGTDDERCSNEAITQTMELRYGPKRVVYDPNDPEAFNSGISKGYAGVYGGAHSKGQWENIRRAGAIKPAGQIASLATPKPYSKDGTPVPVVPESKWTPGMRWTIAFARKLGRELLGFEPEVRVVRAPNFGACYGGGRLDLSLRRLGHGWFDGPIEQIVDLLIHEFAHEVEMNHLSDRYYNTLTKYAGKTVAYALRKPEDFTR
jgi:hypothetical protein